MKRVVFILAIIMGCMGAMAQKVTKNEVRQLQAFLSQTSEKGGTNAMALGISDISNPTSWSGVTVSNGHVTQIDRKDKKLAGNPDLSNFIALTKLDVSRNALTSLNLTGDTALIDVNAPHNKLTTLTLSNQQFLQRLLCNNNRLNILDVSFDPSPVYINCRNNMITDMRTIGDTNLRMVACRWNN